MKSFTLMGPTFSHARLGRFIEEGFIMELV